MDVSAEKLQFFLEVAWEDSPTSANSLRSFMFTQERRVRELARGGTIGSFSRSNSTQTYRGPGLGQYTPDQIGDAWRYLINLHDAVLDWVKWAVKNTPDSPPSGWPKEPDESEGKERDFDFLVYDRMMPLLKSVTEYEVDLTDLRVRLSTAHGGTTW